MNKMPERSPKDGPVSVNRLGDDRICISAETLNLNPVEDPINNYWRESPHYLEMSEYNAWRIFGMLAIILGIELPKKVGKEIKY